MGISSTKKKHKQLKKDTIPSWFAFRAVQEPRRILIQFTSPPPVYGPPTYTQHLEEMLKKSESELAKVKSELVDEKSEILELQQELNYVY